MEKVIKNMKNNQQGGFIELLVIIIIVLFIMRYFGFTISGLVNWFINMFRSVLR